MRFRVKLLLPLLLSGLSLGGCALKGVEAGQIFADQAIQDIGSSWSEITLEQYAGKEFYSTCSHEDAKRICSTLGGKLGAMKEFKGSEINKPVPTPTPHSERPFLLGITAKADFERGPATILLVVQEREGRWSLNGFQVDSPVLRAQQGPPPGQPGPPPVQPGPPPAQPPGTVPSAAPSPEAPSPAASGTP